MDKGQSIGITILSINANGKWASKDIIRQRIIIIRITKRTSSPPLVQGKWRTDGLNVSLDGGGDFPLYNYFVVAPATTTIKQNGQREAGQEKLKQRDSQQQQRQQQQHKSCMPVYLF